MNFIDKQRRDDPKTNMNSIYIKKREAKNKVKQNQGMHRLGMMKRTARKTVLR